MRNIQVLVSLGKVYWLDKSKITETLHRIHLSPNTYKNQVFFLIEPPHIFWHPRQHTVLLPRQGRIAAVFVISNIKLPFE